MFAIVVRSATDSWETPLPKNSTNFPATSACLRCCGKNTQYLVYEDVQCKLCLSQFTSHEHLKQKVETLMPMFEKKNIMNYF